MIWKFDNGYIDTLLINLLIIKFIINISCQSNRHDSDKITIFLSA